MLNLDLNRTPYTDFIKQHLGEKRIRHCISVQAVAVMIAQKYHIDREKVSLAALLHDCARDFKAQKLLDMAASYGLVLSNLELSNHMLIHSRLGRAMAEKDLGIKDNEILDAIEHHTLGREAMSDLCLAVYIADYLDPQRKLKDHIRIISALEKDLYKAAFLVASAKLSYVLQQSDTLEISSVNFYNWLHAKAFVKG